MNMGATPRIKLAPEYSPISKMSLYEGVSLKCKIFWRNHSALKMSKVLTLITIRRKFITLAGRRTVKKIVRVVIYSWLISPHR